MDPASITSPAFSIGLAMAVGMIAQVLARHLLMPGIVLLLAAGVLVGPDVLDVVRPAELGGALRIIVGFAVAIILFEGGLNLELRRLRSEAKVIRRLVTYGAVITGVGGMLAARFIMHWDWRLSTLFGTLVIVTGPTVVTPLIRRLKVEPKVGTILEAEGVLIDPIGAIIAVVALEVLYAGEVSLAAGLVKTGYVLGGGTLIGAVGGAFIVALLRPKRVVPDGLENVFVLSIVVGLFQISEALLPESGLAAAVAAGMVVGNVGSRAKQGLVEFKEQLTVLMIALLFVLLAADVRIAEVQALGVPALLTVAALMFLVRPVQVVLCTMGANLHWRERTFLAYLAPRGIVAAAVASLFAQTISGRGLPGGDELRALVFMVIAVTVTVQGLTGGPIARWLRVRRPKPRGYAILGANPLALALGRVLSDDKRDIMFVDANPERVVAAWDDGFRATHGQGLQANVIAAIEPDSFAGCIGLTTNSEVNLLWANRIRAETRLPRVHVAIASGPRAIPADQVADAGAFVLFARPRDVHSWESRFARGAALVERWRYSKPGTLPRAALAGNAAGDDEEPFLILTIRRGGTVRPYDDDSSFREKDEADIAIEGTRRADAAAWLEQNGWMLASPAPMRDALASEPAPTH
ncbi:MAG: cation:proton antiporter [Gemmatimonadetes bacterium]|nr:cation:proton antiporter [Gemmatimonadota bacterium]